MNATGQPPARRLPRGAALTAAHDAGVAPAVVRVRQIPSYGGRRARSVPNFRGDETCLSWDSATQAAAAMAAAPSNPAAAQAASFRELRGGNQPLRDTSGGSVGGVRAPAPINQPSQKGVSARFPGGPAGNKTPARHPSTASRRPGRSPELGLRAVAPAAADGRFPPTSPRGSPPLAPGTFPRSASASAYARCPILLHPMMQRFGTWQTLPAAVRLSEDAASLPELPRRPVERFAGRRGFSPPTLRIA